MRVFLETERLRLRRWEQADFSHLASLLQNAEVMHAWEHTFTDEEVQAWLKRSLDSYTTSGLGWFALEHKNSSTIVGQAALTPDVVHGVPCHEISYMLLPRFQRCGYAREAAAGLTEYAFCHLKLSRVIFEIRPENEASRRVAESLGAELVGSFIKAYRNKGMLHLVYRKENHRFAFSCQPFVP